MLTTELVIVSGALGGQIQTFFYKDFIYLLLERGDEREREGKKHQCVVASHTSPAGILAHNPGMCPNRESNQRPFGSQAHTQSTELHQLGLDIFKRDEIPHFVLILPIQILTELILSSVFTFSHTGFSRHFFSPVPFI